VARFVFFVGKGGVGKTTISSAYALHRAATRSRERVLLISTDPAHSLGDVLQVKLGNSAKRLRTPGRVWAQQLDADGQIKRFLLHERGEMLELLSKGSFFTEEELEPLLDTSLPGMAEVAALLAVHELLDSGYDKIVVDTAPMGHAIRLFQMPEHFARLLRVLEMAAARDKVLAQTFGGRVRHEAALERWARMVQRVQQALSREGSQLVLVTTPEPFSLNEATRSAPAFADERQRITDIVLNRVVPVSACVHCKLRTIQATAAHKFLRKHFREAKIFTGEDPGCPIIGATALRAFGVHVFARRKLPSSIRKKPPQMRPVRLESAKWPLLPAPLTLTVGKGGVGKTTISAALAFHHRRTVKNDAVTICSVDPAPSLDDVLRAEIDDQPKPVLGDRKLRAVEFDAIAQFQRWSQQLRDRIAAALTSEQRGVHIDLRLDREFLLALLDLTPPGVDEIFAIFRILDLLRRSGRVVIDMAPTGHALDLLRTPARLLGWTRLLLKTLAAHRTLAVAQDAAVEVARLSQNVRQLLSILRDPERCNLVVVTLAEPLPNRETQRLLGSLNELHAAVGAVIVNRVLIDKHGRCARCQLACEWQTFSLAKLRREMRSSDILISREWETPIAGAELLREFTGELRKLSLLT